MVVEGVGGLNKCQTLGIELVEISFVAIRLYSHISFYYWANEKIRGSLVRKVALVRHYNSELKTHVNLKLTNQKLLLLPDVVIMKPRCRLTAPQIFKV